MDKPLISEVRDHAASTAKQFLNILIDAMFLAGWVCIQFMLEHYIVERFRHQLSEIDSIVLVGFQIVFGVAPAAPILLTMYKHIRLMYYRIQSEIQVEKRKIQAESQDVDSRTSEAD